MILTGFTIDLSDLLCAYVSGCAVTGNAAKDNEVGHSGGTQTICTVDTAGHLTGWEQTGNDSAISFQHFGIAADGHTAHSVMNTGSDFDGIISLNRSNR